MDHNGDHLRELGTSCEDARRGSVPDAPLLQSHGFLGTWNTSLGLDDVGVEQAVRSGLRGDQLIAVMLRMNLYRQSFEAFAEQVARWATLHHFESHAASMELCMQGNCIQRVHLHAFLGPPVDNVAWQSRCVSTVVDVASLIWLGSIPTVRCIRGHSRTSILRHEAVGGMYYVLMQKPGTMFRTGNKWPFQDRLVLGKSMRCRYIECNACFSQLCSDGFDSAVDMVSRGLSILHSFIFITGRSVRPEHFVVIAENQQDIPVGY